MLNRFFQKKLVNSLVLLFITSAFFPLTFLYAKEKKVNRESLKGIIDKPQTDSVIKKIGHFDIENGFERYFFYTLYQIGGKTTTRQGIMNYHLPISELKFPLDAFFFHVNLNLTFLDRITIHYSMHKNMHNRVGKMKDSDWTLPRLKTIYSESDARLNAVFTEVDLIVRLFTVSFFSLKLGAGFMHQYLYYWCSNVEQISIVGLYPYVKFLGRVINYKLQYYMFTLQITPVFRIPAGRGCFEIITALRFSPYLKGKDIDDHLFRGKISKGESTGYALIPSIIFRYIFSNNIFLTTKLEYLYLIANGNQIQSYYNPYLDDYQVTNFIPGWSAKLENRLKSEQLSVSLGAGYSFEF